MIHYPVALVAIYCALQVRDIAVTPLKAHWWFIYTTQMLVIVNFIGGNFIKYF